MQKKHIIFDGNDWIALDKYVTPNSISEITVCAWVLSTDTTNKKFIISFDRSESYRLALKDGGNTYVGWDTTDSESILLMTSEHPVLILMKMDSLTQLKMGIGITFVDGLINPVQ